MLQIRPTEMTCLASLNPTNGSWWNIQIQPALVDGLREKAGLEQSTHFRGWDSEGMLASCRLDLNYPPTSVGGILSFQTVSEPHGTRERQTRTVQNFYNAVKNLVLLVCISLTVVSTAQSQPGVPKETVPEDIGEDGTVRVNTALVTVPASVMDRNGRYIFDLRREEFRIYENGVEQQLAFFASTEKPFTVAILLDVSDSAVFRIEEVKDAAIAFVDQLRADDRAIVIAFARRVEVLAKSTSNKEVLRRAIRSVSISTGTSLYNAVDMTLKQVLHDITGRKAIVLFTDGVDTASLGATFESNVHDAAESEPLIYTVQYDLSPSGKRYMTDNGVHSVGTVGRTQRVIANKYLSLLPEKTGGRQYVAKTVEELRNSFEDIAEELRHQYSLGFYPQNFEQQGQPRRIKVRVNRPKLIVRSRNTYGFDPAAIQ